jgi:hypothetical protein
MATTSVAGRPKAPAGTTTIRVSARAHAALQEIAAKTGRTLLAAVDDVVERERRRLMWEEFNASFRRLKTDPEAWAAYQAEQRGWDVTIGDGLDADEDWSGFDLLESDEG